MPILVKITTLTLFAFLSNCSSMPYKDNHPITQKYLNKEGYFSVHPSGITKIGTNEYDPCKKTKLTMFKPNNDWAAMGFSMGVIVHFKQDENEFTFIDEGSSISKNDKLTFVDANFVDSLNLSNRKIKFKGMAPVTASSLVCEKKIFTGMTSKEFLIAFGKPENVNRTVTSHLIQEQWIYGQKYYYFYNNILKSWQD
jgi:hypothetical protein